MDEFKICVLKMFAYLLLFGAAFLFLGFQCVDEFPRWLFFTLSGSLIGSAPPTLMWLTIKF